MPVERISVEMSPLEQDVYSLMGISPLVLINKEVKDPRSVIVSVKTTEQSNLWQRAEPAWESEMIEAKPSIVVAPEPEPFPQEQPTEIIIPTPEPLVQEEEIKEVVELPDTDTERPIIRRRRRRSSALEN